MSKNLAMSEKRYREKLWWERWHQEAYNNPESVIVERLYVDELLCRLPGYMRALLIKLYWQGYTYKEISRFCLGSGKKGLGSGKTIKKRISENGISKRHAKALELLRGMIEGEVG